MNDDKKKLLTEFLGECYHKVEQGPSNVFSCSICGYTPDAIIDEYNRTFTTQDDMMALYRRLQANNSWLDFVSYLTCTIAPFSGCVRLFNATDIAWLFCLNSEESEKRCEAVSKFLEEANHE